MITAEELIQGQEDVTKNNPQEEKEVMSVRLFGTNSLKEGAV
jgi:hypothetical protein